MKKIILIFTVVVSLLGASNSFAQQGKQGKTPEQMAENRSNVWKKQLALSDDQTTQIKAAILDKVTKLKAARTNADKAAKKTAAVAAKTEFDTKVKSILTPEQYTSYIAKKEEAKQKGKAKQAEKGKKKAPVVEDATEDEDLDQ